MPLGIFAGLATLDVIQQADRIPGPNEKITGHWQTMAAGGPAANAAVVFAALGGQARLLTALGTGPAARLVRADLEDYGVEVIDVGPRTGDAAVSSAIITTATGERSVVSSDAAGRSVPAPAPDQVGRLLAGAEVVLLDGHHPLLAVAASREASHQHIPVVLDAGRWRPVMEQLLPAARAVICSADFRVPGTRGAAESAAAVAARGAALVAVTRGGDPILWWEKGRTGQVRVPTVKVVDTLGAGDFFHGAFCWFLARPLLSTAERLAAAAEIAALRCTQLGPRGWLQDLQAPGPASPRSQTPASAQPPFIQ